MWEKRDTLNEKTSYFTTDKWAANNWVAVHLSSLFSASLLLLLSIEEKKENNVCQSYSGRRCETN